MTLLPAVDRADALNEGAMGRLRSDALFSIRELAEPVEA